MSQPIRIGIIGCGAISGAYLKTCKQFPMLEIAACADINRQTAEKKAAEFGVGRVLSVDEMLADKSRISVSVATVQFRSQEASTHLLLTEQGVFLDGYDTVAQREEGTHSLLDSLAVVLHEGAP